MKSSWNEKMKKRLEAKTVKAYEKELKEKRNTELRVSFKNPRQISTPFSTKDFFFFFSPPSLS